MSDEAKKEMTTKIYGLYKTSNISRDACIELIGRKVFDELDNPPAPPKPEYKTRKYSFVNIKTKSQPTDILAGWSCVCVVRDENDKIVYSFMTEPTSKRMTMGKLKEMLERIVSGTLKKAEDLSVGFLDNRFTVLDREDLKGVTFLTLQTDPWKVSYSVFKNKKFGKEKVVSDHNRADVWQNCQMEIGKWNQFDESPSTKVLEK